MTDHLRRARFSSEVFPQRAIGTVGICSPASSRPSGAPRLETPERQLAPGVIVVRNIVVSGWLKQADWCIRSWGDGQDRGTCYGTR